MVQKIKRGRKTENTKNLRSFITVKAHCSMTHLKLQKSLGFFYSTPLGRGCNRSHIILFVLIFAVFLPYFIFCTTVA